MKPTQQEAIDLARKAGFGIGQGISAIRINGYADDLLRLAELLLERFGAGGGEPVAFMVETEVGVMVWPAKDHDEALTYCAQGDLPTNLYTRPSTANLRAEYLRGLEDAAKIADANAIDEPYGHAKFRCVNIAEAIRALKGKQ